LTGWHNGGKILIGPDQNVYLVVGDIDNSRTQAQNEYNGRLPDGTSVIYRITQDGLVLQGVNPLGNTEPFNKYYAYGIRNSFGMDFDPVTGKLWDTENGPTSGDEINLVEPGFNSGWIKVWGIWKKS
jgi:glucose/arabinose dehydrogenase